MHVPQCWQMLLVGYVPSVLCLLFHCHSILQNWCFRIGFELSKCWVCYRQCTPEGKCHIYWYKAAYSVVTRHGGYKHCQGCYLENISVATKKNDECSCRIHPVKFNYTSYIFPDVGELRTSHAAIRIFLYHAIPPRTIKLCSCCWFPNIFHRFENVL